MEVRVHVKICEGCGCLWYRAHTQQSVYCRKCERRLSDFPSPASRKRRGRPAREGPRNVLRQSGRPQHGHLGRLWAVADAAGGAL